MNSRSSFARVRDRLQLLLPPRFRASFPLVAVVRLSGVIGSVLPLRPGLSLSVVAPALERAFSTRGAKAVAIIVNSPGGSAVQSHLIFRRIRAHAEESKLPVLVFVEDAAASGGYWLACAADEIVADPASILGTVVGIAAGSMIGRGWLVALIIFAAGLSDEDAGLAAAVLVILLFTAYFTVSMIMRPFQHGSSEQPS